MKRCAKRYGVPWKNSKQLTEPRACQKHKETRFFASLEKNIITSILPGPRQPSKARLDEKPNPSAASPCSCLKGRKRVKASVETSRTIIRATQLRLLPGVHPWSIHQVVSLGS